MKSTINWMKDKKYILFCFLILLIAILITIGINVNAATDTAGQIEKERTLLRSTIAIAQAEDSNGQVTQTALQTLLNNRNITTTVTQATSTTLQVTFSASGRSYIIDMNAGLVYSVAFNANGGTGAPATQYATQGKATKISKTEPTRDGYDFLGWATSSTATTAEYPAGAKFTPTANSTLYAVWEAATVTYTITLNANGGTFSDGNVTISYEVEEGEVFSIPLLSFADQTFEGKMLLGWALSSNSIDVDYETIDTITPTSDMILYAVWGLAKHVITFDANGGYFTNQLITTKVIVVNRGDSIGVVPNPTNTQKGFGGWKDNETGTVYTRFTIQTVVPTKSMTFTAVWIGGERYGDYESR